MSRFWPRDLPLVEGHIFSSFHLFQFNIDVLHRLQRFPVGKIFYRRCHHRSQPTFQYRRSEWHLQAYKRPEQEEKQKMFQLTSLKRVHPLNADPSANGILPLSLHKWGRNLKDPLFSQILKPILNQSTPLEVPALFFPLVSKKKKKNNNNNKLFKVYFYHVSRTLFYFPASARTLALLIPFACTTISFLRLLITLGEGRSCKSGLNFGRNSKKNYPVSRFLFFPITPIIPTQK